MSKKLDLIRQKIETMGYGLLRSGKGAKQQAMLVSASVKDGYLLNCIIKDDNPGRVLTGRKVSLVQKNDTDYLYISGRINNKEVQNTNKMVCLRITKASWFTRKRRGKVIWLQEKYTFESPGRQLMGRDNFIESKQGLA